MGSHNTGPFDNRQYRHSDASGHPIPGGSPSQIAQRAFPGQAYQHRRTKVCELVESCQQFQIVLIILAKAESGIDQQAIC